jgi:predicted nucleic acid-binding protein
VGKIIKEVCVDACLMLKLVLNEEDSALAENLFAKWQEKGVKLIAPVFFHVEMDSVVQKKASLPGGTDRITPEQAEAAFEALQAIPVKTINEPGQRQRAWELARDLGLPVVYDSHYLALAELRGCEFWTSDARLYNAVNEKIPYIRLLK